MVVTKPETEEGQSSPLIADKLTEGKGVQFNSQVTSDVREWERDALTWHLLLSQASGRWQKGGAVGAVVAAVAVVAVVG